MKDISIHTSNSKSDTSTLGESGEESDLPSAVKFFTAREILTSRSKYFRISTGSKAIDSLLGGGIEQGAITEFYGEFRTGKTQICLQLLLSVTLPPSCGGMGGKAIFIDTEGNFRPERIRQMCGRYDIDVMEVLDRIFVGRAHSTEMQMQLVSEVEQIIENEDFRLLIIDSLTSNFRVEFIGEAKLIERQQKLNMHLNQLAQLSVFQEDRPLAVVFTNQVIGNVSSPHESLLAVGGHIVSHASTHRVHLSRTTDFSSKLPALSATLIDSPYLPEATVNFRITENGIEDIEDSPTPEFSEFLQKVRDKALHNLRGEA